MFFKSEAHKLRFLTAIQDIGKVYEGKLDQEYAAALYILTATSGTWEKASSYVSHDGIDFPAMLQEEDFSSGYLTLIKLAGNLFNGEQHLDPLEFMGLDEFNFRAALTALELRHYSHHIDDFFTRVL